MSSLISDAQVMCETIYVLAGVSPKRVLLFQNIQKEMAACNDGDTESQKTSLTGLSLEGK